MLHPAAHALAVALRDEGAKSREACEALARHLSVLETGSDVLEVIAEREWRVQRRIVGLTLVALLSAVVFWGLPGAVGGV